MTEANDHAAARAAGRAAAREAVNQAPDDPLLRVAWAHGFAEVDLVRSVVAVAREAGATWKEIAAVTGEHWRTAQTKYGTGYEAQRRYRERKKADAQEPAAEKAAGPRSG